MPSRYFEFCYQEICLAVGRRISRYDLWLHVWNAGGDPDDMTREQAHIFIEDEMPAVFAEEGVVFEGRPRRRLERRLLAFDPTHPTPEEHVARPRERAT